MIKTLILQLERSWSWNYKVLVLISVLKQSLDYITATESGKPIQRRNFGQRILELEAS